MKTHFGGGPDPKGIGKVGPKPAGPPGGKSSAMKVSAAVSNKITIGKGDAIHGKMKGQSSGSHGGNVHAGKYHKPFGG